MAISVTGLYSAPSRGSRSDVHRKPKNRAIVSANRRTCTTAHGRGLEKNQRRAHPGHHYFRQRHGHRRARPASPRAPPGFAQRNSAGRLSGARHPRPRAGGWRENRAHSRPGCPGARRDHQAGQFSAHAGRSELLRWLSGFPRRRAKHSSCTANRTRWKVYAPESTAAIIGRW